MPVRRPLPCHTRGDRLAIPSQAWIPGHLLRSRVIPTTVAAGGFSCGGGLSRRLTWLSIPVPGSTLPAGSTARRPITAVAVGVSPSRWLLCPQVLSGMVLGRHFRTPVPLVTVFDALGRLGLLADLLGELSARVRRDVLDPLLSARCVPPPKVRGNPARPGEDVMRTPADLGARCRNAPSEARAPGTGRQVPVRSCVASTSCRPGYGVGGGRTSGQQLLPRRIVREGDFCVIVTRSAG